MKEACHFPDLSLLLFFVAMAKYIQAWDIEGTGARLFGKDVVFAIGTTTLRIDKATGMAEMVEQERWVLDVNPEAKTPWDELWKTQGWEWRCFEEFWSKHTLVLDALMTKTPAIQRFKDQGAMAASVAKYLEDTETRYGDDILRIYDTVGYDVTEIGNLLERHGHTSIFLVRKGWPAEVSYLGDVRRAALGVNLLFGSTPEQKKARQEHDKQALPAGLEHTHDPADDAASIAFKWVHYWRMLPVK